ncbi:Surfactin synthase thioesterase subunit [Amycolatopsis xylanica]|uniref:Surfactin synthase thioesterase subunit n=1 Tax=Amycolatopsis xylanica TaxID=589385 RepID=A0A1H3GPK5_9PSEU|nr:Surfactin synthase thioesterase subunit [Amycolatopsis xylanica]
MGTLREIATADAVWGAEYPGRGDRIAERLPATLEELAERLTLEFVERFGENGVTKTMLIGFSMGAFVALEMTRRVFTYCGAEPATLVVVGAIAPHRRRPSAYPQTDEALTRLLDRDGLVPPEVRDYALDLLRGDMALMEKYRGPAEVPVSCPLIALCGADDPARAATDDATGAWRRWTTGPFRAELVPGGHLDLLKPGHGSAFWHVIER